MPVARDAGMENRDVSDKKRILRYLQQQEKIRSRELYEEMFPEDEPEFVDAYYRYKSADNEILVLEEEQELISMLHLNPYCFWFRGSLVESNYIVAVATKPMYRHQGCMRQLLTKALSDLYEKRQPFTFLMPASEAIYRPFDFRFVGNEDGEQWEAASSEALSEQFDLFIWKDSAYENRNIPDQEWETTPMMMRIVCLETLLAQIGVRTDAPVSLSLDVRDEILSQNTGRYEWILQKDGSALRRLAEEKDMQKNPELSADIAGLTEFLLGNQPPESLFPGLSEEIYAKLHGIHVLKRIYINETV